MSSDEAREASQAEASGARRRLGVYQDGPFRLVDTAGGVRLAPDPVDAPFFSFVAEVAKHFDSLVVFARIVAADTADSRLLLSLPVTVVQLPDYGSLRQLASVVRAAFRTSVSFWRGLTGVEVVWAFGPHPFQLLLVLLASLRGKQVVVGVRQDTRQYFRARLPSRRWKPILGAVAAMDMLHRLLARRIPVTMVAAGTGRSSSGRKRVLTMMPSLVRAAEVVSEPPERDWTGDIELLTAGRIDPEKNPILLVETMAALERRRPGRYRLVWAGVGPLADAVRHRAAELQIEDRVELLGYVPFRPDLLALYRRAHAFVHVSLSEGVPQVLVEALASGTPVVATDVGGVRSALDGGRAGLLVPPSDAEAVAAAVIRLSDHGDLRSQLVERGIALARERTLEAEAARVAAFLRSA